MIAHCIIISTQCAVLAAFLILWYFWVKKRIETSLHVGGEEQILFPFRYFSWVLISLILVTCLAQIHFVRVSATVHEKMAAMTNFYRNQEQTIHSLEELKATIKKLRRDVDSNFRGLRAQMASHGSVPKDSEITADLAVAHVDQLKEEALASLQSLKNVQKGASFAKEAKASSAGRAVHETSREAKYPRQGGSKVYSMRLSRVGRVVEEDLSVKKRPEDSSPVIEKLAWGQEVKVTEKRVSHEDIWFRIVTPSGRAGWVDYRQLKLEGNS